MAKESQEIETEDELEPHGAAARMTGRTGSGLQCSGTLKCLAPYMGMGV